MAREGGRHDHQRQAIAFARGEGFGGVAGVGGIVIEFQFAAGIERVEQAALLAAVAGMVLEARALEIGFHRGAEREQLVGVDRLGRRFEVAVAVQIGRWRHRRKPGFGGAAGEHQAAQRKEQPVSGFHHSLRRKTLL
ncbi:hypothetical protein LP419_24705 [Massilia sp. H-1]|nr:hypothetical protein LP419_24705 [Massilia sp. H-1]